MDILNIDELRVLKVETNDLDYLITAECKEQPDVCIRCYRDKLIKHTINERLISDV